MSRGRALLEALKELGFWVLVGLFLALTLPYAARVMFGDAP